MAAGAREAEPSPDPALAAWLIARRRGIEQAMAARLGPSAPGPGAPETEALRRFRAFAAQSLRRGEASPPSLDGVRAPEARVATLLEAWTGAARSLAGERGEAVGRALQPLVQRFRAALRDTAPARRKSGAPRTGRRAVRAAIDRVADAYVAVDVDTRCVVDANPAAGALLGLARDALVGMQVAPFLDGEGAGRWATELDALAEGSDTRRFRASLRDLRGTRLRVDVSATRYAPRGRLLALLLLRPDAG